MGRKKIDIKKISSEKNRHVTFNKRRVGLMKKAMELSILCGCEVGLMVFFDDKMNIYSSSDIDDLIRRYHDFEGSYENLDNNDIYHLQPGRASSFKGSGKKEKLRSLPCHHCGRRSNNNIMQAASPPFPALNADPVEFQRQMAAAEAAARLPFQQAQQRFIRQLQNQGGMPTKRQRVHALISSPNVEGRTNFLQNSSADVKGSSLTDPHNLQGFNRASSASSSSGAPARVSGTSLLQKRKFTPSIRQVVIPDPKDDGAANQQNQQLINGVQPLITATAGQATIQQTPTTTTPTTIFATPAAQPGAPRVPPSPSSFFSTDSQQVSQSFGEQTSLSPFGWRFTPTNPNGKMQSFNRIPGHPEASTSTAAVSVSSTMEASGAQAKSPNIDQKKPLSLRRGQQLKSLNLSSLGKPNRKVVELSSAESANAPPSVLGSARHPSNRPLSSAGLPPLTSGGLPSGLTEISPVWTQPGSGNSANQIPVAQPGNFTPSSFMNLSYPSPGTANPTLQSPKISNVTGTKTTISSPKLTHGPRQPGGNSKDNKKKETIEAEVATTMGAMMESSR